MQLVLLVSDKECRQRRYLEHSLQPSFRNKKSQHYRKKLKCSLLLWTRLHKVWRERKPTRCNNQMFIINFCLNMFLASLCPSSGEQRPCVTAYGVLRWFCWMWLVAVVGACVVGCEQRSTPYAVTHGLCSPVDGHNDARNMLRQKLIINTWLLHLVGFLSLHTLLTMHGHGT